MSQQRNRLLHMSFSLQAEISALADAGSGNVLERLATLKAEVAAYGPQFEVRDDSKLAWKYCSDIDAHTESFWNEASGTADLSKIALELVAMQLLYSTPLHTNKGDRSFKDLQEAKLRELANWAKQTHPSLPWKRVWAIVRDSGTPLVKLAACKNMLVSTK